MNFLYSVIPQNALFAFGQNARLCGIRFGFLSVEQKTGFRIKSHFCKSKKAIFPE